MKAQTFHNMIVIYRNGVRIALVSYYDDAAKIVISGYADDFIMIKLRGRVLYDSIKDRPLNEFDGWSELSDYIFDKAH